MTDTSIKLRFPVLGNNVFYYIFDHQINQSHFMKKILYLLLFSTCLSINAQVARLSGATDINTGIYLKDIDNILPQFTGEWTAKYDNNQVTLNIEKIEKHPLTVEKVNYYSDILFLRYSVKDSQGKEIFSNLHKTITDAGVLKSSNASLENRSVGIEYAGEECHIGEGYITLTYKDPTHIIWEYIAEDKPIDKTKCPNADKIKSYIPATYELIFTKK